MSLPFSEGQFLDTMARYNEAVWPAQAVLLVLGILAVARAAWGGTAGARQSAAMLAVLWAWMAIGYHLAFFRAINPAATVFALAFVVQALLLARAAWRGGIELAPRADVPGVVGGALVALALVAYPVLALAAGHHYPVTPTFGLPCPTTILTIGLLVWGGPHVPRSLWIVPLVWTVVGGSGALLFGMREDLSLAVAGVAGAAMLVRQLLDGMRHAPRPA